MAQVARNLTDPADGFLRVRARAAHAAGVAFHWPDGLPWLARAVPAEFVVMDGSPGSLLE